jgi:hypothetical protein
MKIVWMPDGESCEEYGIKFCCGHVDDKGFYIDYFSAEEQGEIAEGSCDTLIEQLENLFADHLKKEIWLLNA